VPGDGKRERLRQTFDQVAESYDRIRPDYPERLFDDLIALTGIRPGDHLLEVGCGTGKATLPLARRGFRITCIELGPELAAVARRNLAGFPVEVIERRFEEWRSEEPVSLVFAATAWHWIDPALRYALAWHALRPGAHLAIWAQEHVFPDGGDPFFREIQDVYDEIGEGLPAGTPWPRPGELPEDRAGIEASGLFEVVAVRQYDWEVAYSAEEYVELLGTFSGHLIMADWQRDRLSGEIHRRIAGRPGRSVRRGWGAVLHVARRRERGLRGPLDLAEELRVGPGLMGLVQEKLERLLRLDRAERAAQLADGLVLLGRHQQLIVAGAGRQRVDGGEDPLLHRPAHVGDLFWPLADEHHHEVNVGVAGRDRGGDGLQDHRLARLGRGHDEGALAQADRGDEVDDPRGV
jgi:SAM-dependent methyltransferase